MKYTILTCIALYVLLMFLLSICLIGALLREHIAWIPSYYLLVCQASRGPNQSLASCVYEFMEVDKVPSKARYRIVKRLSKRNLTN